MDLRAAVVQRGRVFGSDRFTRARRLRAAASLLIVAVTAGAGCLAQPELLPGSGDDGGLPPGADGALGGDGGGVIGDGPYCEVAARVFVPKCTACHRAGGTPPDLSFAAVAAAIGAPSTFSAGRTIVVAGAPAASLLYRKVAGTQAGDEGGRMPIGTTLSSTELALVETWIAGGASTECEVAPGDAGLVRYHPEGFVRPEQHGLSLTSGAQDCRSCHGATLEGAGAAPSCDSCHQPGWRTECTFCHGGGAGPGETTGAPPRGLLRQLARDEQTFRPHREHITAGPHPAYDCTECHAKPMDVLSAGHVFDGTPGVAEVDFSGGLSASATYDGPGGCASLYCHGNGRASNGSIRHDTPRPQCGSCHAGPASAEAAWSELSGNHRKHLRELRVSCVDCHAATTDRAGGIAGGTRHVDGVRDVVFAAAGMSRAADGRCSGSCHSEAHDRRDWYAD